MNSSLTLVAAQGIISGALAAARACGANPLAVVVLDAGGHPVAFAREDGASLFRFDIARAKAMGAQGNPAFFQSLAVAVGGQVAFSAGGVLIRADGAVIGAVGISGDTGDRDEDCALAGIRAAGLMQETAA